jgi:protein-tyrosine phosphatase
MPQVLRWPATRSAGTEPDWPPAVVDPCRHALLRGELVVLPTDAAYVLAANGLTAGAVARLAAACRISDGVPLPAVALLGAAGARDWVHDLGVIGRRLANRCWPGPVVLVFAEGVKAGVATRLPDGVLRTIGPGWELGLTVPRHAAVRELLEALPVPLVLLEVSDRDGSVATTLDAALAAVGDAAAVAVDGGPIETARPTTVVEVRGGSWAVRREGAVPAGDVARLAARLVLFVCTGNTCRSPLAEALCKKRLADRLGCAIDDLPARGFVISSAGLAAVRGEPAAAEAVAVAAEVGADLSGHASRPVTPDLLAGADDVIGMTAGHLLGLAGFAGRDVGARVRLLCGEDLADPIGGDRTVYQACAGTIWQHLQGLVDELVQG